MADMKAIAERFLLEGTVREVKPLGEGLINQTFLVLTAEPEAPDYVLQRINNAIFTDVDLLQDNIEKVTRHIRRKLEAAGEDDIDRKVLRFLPTRESVAAAAPKSWALVDGTYWRLMVYIKDSITYQAVTPEYSEICGRAFGHFEYLLSDIPDRLGDTIPNFHNMEFRLKQLQDAVAENRAGRLGLVRDVVDELLVRGDGMCKAERLGREGILPKRICHCDTKVNNMLFDKQGNVLCIIDLDTVMPNFVFSDYGDFLRTAANFVAEDDPDIESVGFNMEIFKAFTRGYLEGTRPFLTPVEIENLPYAAKLFPYMQCARFLTDYLNGDTYYKCLFPEHNLVRTQNQLALVHSVDECEGEMKAFIAGCLK